MKSFYESVSKKFYDDIRINNLIVVGIFKDGRSLNSVKIACNAVLTLASSIHLLSTIINKLFKSTKTNYYFQTLWVFVYYKKHYSSEYLTVKILQYTFKESTMSTQEIYFKKDLVYHPPISKNVLFLSSDFTTQN